MTAQRKPEPARCAEAEILGLICVDCLPLGECRLFVEASISTPETSEEDDSHEAA